MHASLTFWNTDCSPKGTVLAWLALSRYRGDDAVRQGHKQVYEPALDLIRQLGDEELL